MDKASVDLFETWTARDGGTVVIRPIMPGDEATERAFVDALSPQTSYQRLLSPRHLTDAEIAHFTHIDYDREVALVAIDDTDAMVGVTRYVRGLEHAEWAIVLADAWQGRGLGRALLERLIAIARRSGVTRLSDLTLSTNANMIGLAKTLGFTATREMGDATLTRMTLVL